LLYIADCPNRDPARRHLDVALARTDLVAVIRAREIRSAEEAIRLGMRGSPTILIDGRDPFGEAAGPPALSCRLYRGNAGFSAAPTVDQLVRALHEDAEGGPVTQPAVDLSDTGDLDEVVAESVRRIAIAGFWALWREETASVDEIVVGDAAALAAAVEHLRARGRIEISDDGHLLAVHGLTRRETPHRIEHAAGAVNTWCALDAIGIPAALAIDARAVTRCPTCECDLAVTVTRGEPEPFPGAVLWYPETADGDHLLDKFCSGANLFCSLDHLQHWIGDQHRRGAVMTVGQIAEVGREAWSDVAQAGDTVIPSERSGQVGTGPAHSSGSIEVTQ